MLPGKKYQPEDFLRILRRRWWIVVAPLIVCSVATIAGSQYLPNKYRSETLIMVVPQRVPESYVKATVTTRIEDRLQSISQQILSRTRLETIIKDFNLYAEQRRTGIMEDVVERMRKDIVVNIVKGDAFRIAYVADSPDTAMKVTERLATLFIDENLKDREVLAEGTNQFLEAQLEEARQKLVDQEKKLEEYRKRFSGQLPSQLQSNLQAQQNTQLQIQSVVDAANRARDRKLMLEQLIAGLPAASGTPAATTIKGDDAAVASGSTAQQLENARQVLAALQQRLTPEHPNVRRMKRTITDLEARAAKEANEPAASRPAAAAPVTADEAARLTRLNDMRAELQSVNREVALKEAEEKRLRAQAADYQIKIDAVPARESELAELTRDNETMQKVYRDLLAKKEDSQVAANLERRQIGEQFKVLDMARRPEKPYSPNRLLIGAAGTALGLGLGLGIVFLLEYNDRSLRGEPDVALVLSLPVLATVPLMITDVERRQARRRRFIAWGSAAASVALTAGVTAWKFRVLIKGWMR